MKIEFEATPQQVNSITRLLSGQEELSDIVQQIKSTAALNDDSQSGEIPEEGDNEIIERME